MDRYVTVKQGEVMYATEMLAQLEGIERGPAGNTALAAAFSLAQELPEDAVLVISETEYTGAGKHIQPQLSFAREHGIDIFFGNPSEEDKPGVNVVLPADPGLIQCHDADLNHFRQSLIRKAVKNPAYDAAAIAALLQQRTEVLTEIPEKLDFFDELPEYDTELFVHKKSKSDEQSAREMLEKVIPLFEALPVWDDESILNAMVQLAEALEVKNAKVMWPVRIAAAGKAVTPGGAVEICRILGREETLRRLRIGLEKLK